MKPLVELINGNYVEVRISYEEMILWGIVFWVCSMIGEAEADKVAFGQRAI